MAPKLTRVVRLDSLPLNQTYFTAEGYLVDRPILTSTGIFEYTNPDGSVRRELRLPEEVFKPESLQSYKGKPIIITHGAGLITKDNVHENAVGTILSEGYRSGNDVRAEIIIHDTDEMKSAGLKELSLGYNLDLEETPGVWEGQPYDVIQRNIVINHLALVMEARAGDQARLNIDGRDQKTKGAKTMSANPKTKKGARRADGVMSPEELAKAIEAYKARRAQRMAAKGDEGDPTDKPPAATDPSTDPTAKDGDDTVIGAAGQEPDAVEEKVQMVKDRRDRRDQEGDPKTLDEANGVIANQDDDMEILFDIIDTLLAQKAFDASCGTTAKDSDTEPADPAVARDGDNTDPTCTDGDDVVVDKTKQADSDDDPVPTATPADLKKGEVLNADSVDSIVRQRVQIGVIGTMLNLDGLDGMGLIDAKKAIIKAVRPEIRLDGKSPAYVNAMFDCACSDVKSRNRKDTGYQRSQMFNRDSRNEGNDATGNSARAARQRMLERRNNKAKEDK